MTEVLTVSCNSTNYAILNRLHDTLAKGHCIVHKRQIRDFELIARYTPGCHSNSGISVVNSNAGSGSGLPVVNDGPFRLCPCLERNRSDFNNFWDRKLSVRSGVTPI